MARNDVHEIVLLIAVNCRTNRKQWRKTDFLMRYTLRNLTALIEARKMHSMRKARVLPSIPIRCKL